MANWTPQPCDTPPAHCCSMGSGSWSSSISRKALLRARAVAKISGIHRSPCHRSILWAPPARETRSARVFFWDYMKDGTYFAVSPLVSAPPLLVWQTQLAPAESEVSAPFYLYRRSLNFDRRSNEGRIEQTLFRTTP